MAWEPIGMHVCALFRVPYAELGDGQVMEIVISHLSLEKGEKIVPFKAALEHITRLCRVMVSRSVFCVLCNYNHKEHTHSCVLHILLLRCSKFKLPVTTYG